MSSITAFDSSIEETQINALDPVQVQIQPEDKPHFWTNARIKKLAIYAFAGLALFAAAAVAFVSFAGSISTPCALLAIPLVVLAGGLIVWAHRIKDYQNPKSLQKMKDAAPYQSFKELYKSHGLDNIHTYKILDLPLLKKKFHEQLQMMSFRQVLSTFKGEKLMAYGLATPEHVQYLKELESAALQSERQFYSEKQALHYRYPQRTEVIKKHIDNTRHNINYAVMATKDGDFYDKINAYTISNAITTPLSIVGDLIAEKTGASQQIAYDAELSIARGRHIRTMTDLNGSYTSYKQQLLQPSYFFNGSPLPDYISSVLSTN